MSAMIGAAMSTERPTDRAGALVSPARMAMYSNPPRAPKPILPRMFKLYNENEGMLVRNGWNSRNVRVSKPSTGNSSRTPKMMSMKTPPVLCTHFPTDNPTVDATTINARITAAQNDGNHRLVVIHPALRPMAYDRYVAHEKPISDVN